MATIFTLFDSGSTVGPIVMIVTTFVYLPNHTSSANWLHGELAIYKWIYN